MRDRDLDMKDLELVLNLQAQSAGHTASVMQRVITNHERTIERLRDEIASLRPDALLGREFRAVVRMANWEEWGDDGP